MASAIERAHESFTNALRKEAKELLLKEDLPLYLSIIRTYFLILPIKLFTIDLFSPSKFRTDLELVKAAPYFAEITLFDIKLKLAILFRNDVSARAIFFYNTHIARRIGLEVLENARGKTAKEVQPRKRVEQIKRSVANRYISASKALRKLIREAIQKDNEPLMEDLFVRLAWLQIFAYGNNALSPELDALIEKVTGERI